MARDRQRAKQRRRSRQPGAGGPAAGSARTRARDVGLEPTEAELDSTPAPEPTKHAFPDVATTLALRGAQILVIPSAAPFGYEHLLTLRTRARAQDNQVFAVGCNLTSDGFCGRSLVADPRGDVLAEAGVEETVFRAALDLAAIDREREREPALRFRRPDLYHHGRA